MKVVQASNCYDTVLGRQTEAVLYPYDNALVIGSGSFGTALSFVLAGKFKNVFVTSRNSTVLDQINRFHVNRDVSYINLPVNVRAVFFSAGYRDPILEQTDWDLVVFALPLPSLSLILKGHDRFFSLLVRKQVPFVSLSKGIETKSLKFSDDVFLETWPELKDNLIILSGPSFAKEILEEQLTFVTLAGENENQIKRAHQMLSTKNLKASLTRDVKGVLIGGAVKNVIAIAVGIVEGLGASANTKAGFMTLLFNEMSEFSRFYGARIETLHDFSGLGDVFLSSEGAASRNKKFGLALGQGQNVEDFIKENTVEGYHTVFSIKQMIEQKNMDLPLFQALFQVLYEGDGPHKLIQNLEEREVIVF